MMQFETFLKGLSNAQPKPRENFIKQFECNNLKARKFRLKGNQFKNPLKAIITLSFSPDNNPICKIQY